MIDWLRQLAELARQGEPAVLVTVAGVRGSAPRETGAKMLVTRRESVGTIGGGELEYQCLKIAAERLRDGDAAGFLRRFPLGSNCGQCCGGVVDVLFEPLAGIGRLDDVVAAWTARRDDLLVTTLDADGRPQKAVVERGQAFCELPATATARRVDTPGRGEDFLLVEALGGPDLQVAVFGAGHVGSALVRTLAGLPASIRWIDGRRDIFPDTLPGNLQCIAAAEPWREAAALPPSSYAFVMTHSHALDLEITAALLARGDLAYVGLIGSTTKRRRFERRLADRGLAADTIARLACPIGLRGIPGKTPQEIAIAAAAELLEKRERLRREEADDRATVRSLPTAGKA